MTRLIDSSIVVKWVVREADSDRATELYGSDLAAPDLILVEVANILWKKVRLAQIDAAQAIAGLSEIGSLLDVLPTLGLESRALEMALALEHPVYDCIYLALAEAMETRVITADQRLVARCAGTPFASLIESLT